MSAKPDLTDPHVWGEMTDDFFCRPVPRNTAQWNAMYVIWYGGCAKYDIDSMPGKPWLAEDLINSRELADNTPEGKKQLQRLLAKHRRCR